MPTGNPVRMVGMCMDITHRKLTEEALRKTEKLAAAGRLAATIAHEVNNPLEAVTNLIFLARKESNQAERNGLLEMADKELQRVSHITRQTLGFYRDSGRAVKVDLGEVVTNVLDVFQGKLKSKGVQAHFDSQRGNYCLRCAGGDHPGRIESHQQRHRCIPSRIEHPNSRQTPAGPRNPRRLRSGQRNSCRCESYGV